MRVLFVVPGFEMGGITSSLRNLSSELIAHGDEVDILNLPKITSLPDGFNEKISLIELDDKSKFWNFCYQDIINKEIWKRSLFMLLGGTKKFFNRIGIWNRTIFSKLDISSDYDLAIAFRQEPVSYYIVENKINCKKKVGFWHGDPDWMGDMSSWDQCVYGMDYIACVSDYVGKRMLIRYPQLNGKVRTVYNIFEAEQIKEKAKAFQPDYSENYFNIVTVARIETPPKKIETIPAIFDKIRNFSGKKVRWYIVGDGPDRSLVESSIKEYHCEDNVILLGAQKNPYPYIKNADLFVLTSSWESYGMVIMEALILGVPVVAGNYGALPEILQNPLEGIITENNVQGIAGGICSLLENEEQYCIMKEYLSNYQYDPEVVYQQLMDLCK